MARGGMSGDVWGIGTSMNAFFAKLKRRNVFRAGVAYIVISRVARQFVDVV